MLKITKNKHGLIFLKNIIFDENFLKNIFCLIYKLDSNVLFLYDIKT